MIDNLYCTICQAIRSHAVVQEAEDAILTCEECAHALKFPASEDLQTLLDAHNGANAPDGAAIPVSEPETPAEGPTEAEPSVDQPVEEPAPAAPADEAEAPVTDEPAG